jgi:hypothetical protein
MTYVRESIADIKRLVQDNSERMEQVVKRSKTLRDKHPNINVPATILDKSDPKTLSDVQSILTSTEFAFDEEVINSKAYRRAMAMATMRADAKDPGTGVVDSDYIDLASSSLDGETKVDELSVASAVVKPLNLCPLPTNGQPQNIGLVAPVAQEDIHEEDQEPQSALFDALEKTMLPFMPPQSTSSRVTSFASADSGTSKPNWSRDSAIGISRGSSLSSSSSQSPTKTTPLDSESVAEPDEEQEDERPPPLPPRPIARTNIDVMPASRTMEVDGSLPLVPEPLASSKDVTTSPGELKDDPAMIVRRRGFPPLRKTSPNTPKNGPWTSENPLEAMSIEDAEVHSIWSSLLTSEQKFIDYMAQFRKIFYDPIIKEWPILEKHIDVVTISDELAELHRMYLLEPANKMISTHDLGTCDPGVFEFWAIKTQKLYKKYAQQIPHAESSIRLTCSMEPKFLPFLDSLGLSTVSSGKGWEEYLRLPVTQLNIYVEKLHLLLEKTQVVTAVPTDRYEVRLQQALHIIKNLQESCNRYIAESTKREEIQTLYRRIELVKTNPLSHLGLSETGRHIIHQGPMAIKVNGIGSWKAIHLILLDNYLLWGRVKPPKAWKHQERKGDNIWVLEHVSISCFHIHSYRANNYSQSLSPSSILVFHIPTETSPNTLLLWTTFLEILRCTSYS